MERFGSFEFDETRRRLLRAGNEVHLTPKAFDLLALLIDAAPRVVPKTELHARLWPNGVVSDATLVGLVKELRRALGDKSPSASAIRTVTRVGYAFDAPLVAASASRDEAWRWLVMREKRIPLAEGENVIGRDPESGVRLDDATVSRRHARIVISRAGAVLEDLGSKNGTCVADTRLTAPTGLRDGDQVIFGQVTVTYREAAGGLSTATQANPVENA